MEGKYLRASSLPFGQKGVFDLPKTSADSFRMYAYESNGSKLVISGRHDLSFSSWRTDEAYVCFIDVLYVFSNIGFFAGIHSFSTADYNTTKALHVMLQENRTGESPNEPSQGIDFSQYRLFTSEIDIARFQVYATAVFIIAKNPVTWTQERP